MTLDGKVAVVTGGSGGLGAEIARSLGSRGAQVVISYFNGAESAHGLVDELAASGVHALAVQWDVAQDPEPLIQEAVSEFGRLDIVVSNAGTASPNTIVADTPRDVVERAMTVHAVGPHQLVRAALPFLRRNVRSDVVFVSSASAHMFHPGAADYIMGKCALEGLARTLAREERRHGVHVNVVAPGMVDAGMGRAALSALGITEEQGLADVPFGRLCTAGNIADVIAFLVSDAGAYVNDQRIVVDGGTFDLPWAK